MSPDVHGGSRKRVTWGRASRSRLRLNRCSGVCRRNLRRSEGWISGEAQIGTSAFQVRGDGVGAAKHRLAVHSRWRPGKADAGLEVGKTVHGVVKRAAVSVLARKFKRAGDQVQVGLAIVQFHPGSVGLVTQSEVQGQASA